MLAHSHTISPATQSPIADQVIIKLNQLSLYQQQEVLDFIEFLNQKNQSRQSIWDKIEERMAQVGAIPLWLPRRGVGTGALPLHLPQPI